MSEDQSPGVYMGYYENALQEVKTLKAKVAEFEKAWELSKALANQAAEGHATDYHDIATALGCHVRDDFPEKINALKAERDHANAVASGYARTFQSDNEFTAKVSEAAKIYLKESQDERAERDAALVRSAALEKLANTVNDIRNSIIAFQQVNWSEHVYPLVAALDAAGIKGKSYDDAKNDVRPLLERAVKAEGLLDAERQARAGLRALLKEAEQVCFHYAQVNPKWSDRAFSDGATQDPCGVHALIPKIEQALADDAQRKDQ